VNPFEVKAGALMLELQMGVRGRIQYGDSQILGLVGYRTSFTVVKAR